MRPRRRASMALLLLGMIAPRGRVVAQAERLTVSGSVSVASRLLWRGITRYAGPAAQVASDIRFSTGRVSLDASLWSTAVAGGCPDEIATCAVSRDPRMADLSGQLGVGIRLGAFRVSTGATWMRSEPSALDPADQRSGTTELFLAGASEPTSHLKVGFQARLDVDEVEGGYFEAWATTPVTIPSPQRPKVFVTAALGYSEGMTTSGGATGYYAADGLTHLLVELTVPLLGCGRCDRTRGSVELFGQLNGNIDDATRRRSPWDPREKDQRGVAGIVARATLPVLR